jgi:alkanesulfonate monooxygenase SsuD/methylene tetrahydromethanopterin reductase-like flavin-dependent oxidoreductase (luciferase family)
MMRMDFGAHLPLMDFGGNPYTLRHLTDYVERAARLGFRALAANDHLVFAVPWLDGPTALTATLGNSGSMTLATTTTIPVVRGPVATAKTLAALDRLSGGRLVVSVGPGSSAADYDAVGIDFGERWARLDEAIRALRALWSRDEAPFVGRFYSTDGIVLRPAPRQDGGPPIWVASWGSTAGLRRTARLGDGWLASAYNTTPAHYAEAWHDLQGMLPAHGKDPSAFPNALATMWCYITEDRGEADLVMRERITPAIHRTEDELRARLPVGPAEAFAEKLSAFAAAGVQRVYIWPVADEARQLELFWETVRPQVETA